MAVGGSEIGVGAHKNAIRRKLRGSGRSAAVIQWHSLSSAKSENCSQIFCTHSGIFSVLGWLCFFLSKVSLPLCVFYQVPLSPFSVACNRISKTEQFIKKFISYSYGSRECKSERKHLVRAFLLEKTVFRVQEKHSSSHGQGFEHLMCQLRSPFLFL